MLKKKGWERFNFYFFYKNLKTYFNKIKFQKQNLAFNIKTLFKHYTLKKKLLLNKSYKLNTYKISSLQINIIKKILCH